MGARSPPAVARPGALGQVAGVAGVAGGEPIPIYS